MCMRVRQRFELLFGANFPKKRFERAFFEWFQDRATWCLAVWYTPIDFSIIENTRQSLVCL